MSDTCSESGGVFNNVRVSDTGEMLSLRLTEEDVKARSIYLNLGVEQVEKYIKNNLDTKQVDDLDQRGHIVIVLRDIEAEKDYGMLLEKFDSRQYYRLNAWGVLVRDRIEKGGEWRLQSGDLIKLSWVDQILEFSVHEKVEILENCKDIEGSFLLI